MLAHEKHRHCITKYTHPRPTSTLPTPASTNSTELTHPDSPCSHRRPHSQTHWLVDGLAPSWAPPSVGGASLGDAGDAVARRECAWNLARACPAVAATRTRCPPPDAPLSRCTVIASSSGSRDPMSNASNLSSIDGDCVEVLPAVPVACVPAAVPPPTAGGGSDAG